MKNYTNTLPASSKTKIATSFNPLYPKTAIAEATIKIFQLNDPDRVIIRQELAIDGRWP